MPSCSTPATAAWAAWPPPEWAANQRQEHRRKAIDGPLSRISQAQLQHQAGLAVRKLRIAPLPLMPWNRVSL